MGYLRTYANANLVLRLRRVKPQCFHVFSDILFGPSWEVDIVPDRMLLHQKTELVRFFEDLGEKRTNCVAEIHYEISGVDAVPGLVQLPIKEANQNVIELVCKLPRFGIQPRSYVSLQELEVVVSMQYGVQLR